MSFGNRQTEAAGFSAGHEHFRGIGSNWKVGWNAGTHWNTGLSGNTWQRLSLETDLLGAPEVTYIHAAEHKDWPQTFANSKCWQ